MQIKPFFKKYQIWVFEQINVLSLLKDLVWFFSKNLYVLNDQYDLKKQRLNTRTNRSYNRAMRVVKYNGMTSFLYKKVDIFLSFFSRKCFFKALCNSLAIQISRWKLFVKIWLAWFYQSRAQIIMLYGLIIF